jgi:DNA-binding FrmR family transcriptional regulator
MVREDPDCPDVLTQVASVRKALKYFAAVIIHQHTKEWIEHGGDPQENQRMLWELLMVLERCLD